MRTCAWANEKERVGGREGKDVEIRNSKKEQTACALPRKKNEPASQGHPQTVDRHEARCLIGCSSTVEQVWNLVEAKKKEMGEGNLKGSTQWQDF